MEEREYCECQEKLCQDECCGNPLHFDNICQTTHIEEVFDKKRGCILVQRICDDYNCILEEWERPIDCSQDDFII